MSYDVELCDAITGDILTLTEPHHMRGGTYAMGGTRFAELNITYNYSGHFSRVFNSRESSHASARDGMLHGIRSLYGLTGAESIPLIERGIEMLGDDVDDEDYWRPTEGNAKRALQHCLSLARMRPDGVWGGD